MLLTWEAVTGNVVLAQPGFTDKACFRTLPLLTAGALASSGELEHM